MKKKIIFPIICLMLIIASFALFACAGDPLNNITVYTIRFDSNYDGNVVKQEVNAGESFTLAEAPTRPGYNFAGWYMSDDGSGDQFSTTYKLEKDVTVFAKWEKDSSKKIVTYKYLNYGTADSTVVVDNGGKVTKPADPKFDENEMCSFNGWYTDEACTVEYDFNATVSADVTLYAGWTQTKTEVKFDANYTGSGKPTVSVAELGKPVTKPADPVRARYEFGNWYTERVGGSVYDFSTAVNEALTLYAHWSRSEYTVTFNLNGGTAEGVDLSYDIKRNESAATQAKAIEDALKFTGHEFIGWYIIKTDPNDEADAPADGDKADLTHINDDMVVYAAWTLESYTVTFDYNYSGAPQAPASQRVKYGKNITEPTVSTRNGYMFVGWFTEAAGTTQFTLDMPVTSDITLYAKWIDAAQAGDATVTFYYVVGGKSTKITEVKVSVGTTAESKLPQDPTAADHLFGGWYSDAQFTKAFNPKAAILEDMSIYGKMLKKYTFEAEAVNLEGMKGQGTSTNSREEGMIMAADFVEGGNVSNGYFLREMYYNGAFINFEIDAAEAIDDAVIYLRVSSESYEFMTTKEQNGKTYNYLSDQEYVIAVNGVIEFDPDFGTPTIVSGQISYGGVYMPMANLEDKEDLSYHKTPFEDCFIKANVHLDKGLNIITLFVNNNNNHGGTFHAEAPIIDCMYIYSAVELTMNDYEYYKRDGVNRG